MSKLVYNYAANSLTDYKPIPPMTVIDQNSCRNKLVALDILGTP